MINMEAHNFRIIIYDFFVDRDSLKNFIHNETDDAPTDTKPWVASL